MSVAMTHRPGANRSWIALASTVVVAAITTAVYIYNDNNLRKKRKRDDSNEKTSSPTPMKQRIDIITSEQPLQTQETQQEKQPEQHPEDDSKIQAKPKTLISRFHAAAKQVPAIPNVTQQDQLRMYGLYKQAIIGDAEDPPSALNLLNPIAGIKHQAWEANQGMSKDSAMSAYIHLVDDVLSGNTQVMSESEEDDLMDVVYSDGANNKPITPAHDGSMDIDCSDEQEAEQDVHIVSPVTVPNHSALHVAARDDHVDELKELLQNDTDMDPNMLDETGQTAMHLAADRGHVECLRLLLDAKADVNAADTDGISVLQAAVISGHADVCKLLLDRGADPDQIDRDGDTPRTCAEDDPEIRKVFVRYPYTKKLGPAAQ